MTTVKTCAQCGTTLDAYAPRGVCPRCVLQAGLLNDASDESFGHADPLEAPLSAKRFGDYELLEELGHGGMGVVYKARHLKLDRLVALKLLLLGQFSSEQAVKRFQREAQAAAALRHPNIVGLHEVGEVEGQHYFTMELVEGRSLASLLRDGPLPPRLAAEYCRAMADAMSAAHSAGIIHRDLKPANILIDLFDQPRITDFGLAKRLDGSGDITLTGHLLGSPNYLAPELAAGREQECGPGTDIFSLGAILYECLTGRPPFLGSTMQETLLRVRDAEPVAPRVLNPKLPRDLETICLKCLEKEPVKRYATAKDLAEELDHFLKGEPIHARPIGSTARLWRWCGRKPALASSFALVLILAIGAPIAAFRINQERLLTRQSLYSADMRLASQAVHEGAFNHTRELLEKYRPRRGAADLRGFEWRYLRHTVQDSEPFRTLEGLPAPSGWEETLLFRSEHFLYNQSLGQPRAWDMTTWEPVPIVPPPQPASVQWWWDPSRGSAYAVDQTQRTLTVYTLPKFESGPTLRLPGSVSKVAMSHDREALAVGFQKNASHRVLVWDLAHDARIGELGNFETTISALVFSHDGTLLAASSTNGVVGIWDLKSLQPLPAPPGRGRHLERLEFTPDNQRLLSDWYQDDSIWDIGARQSLTLEPAGQGYLLLFGLSPDAKYLVASWDGFDLMLFDSRTLLMKGSLRGHRGLIRGIAFSPDGKLIASASVDQTARIWDLATQMEVGIVGGFDERISDVEFSADGQSIVLIGGFGQIRVHQLSVVLQRGLFKKIPGREAISGLALSPDERRLATISVDGTLALWDRQSRSVIRSASYPRYTQKSHPRLAFAPDGKQLAWVTGDALCIMRVESGEISTNAIDGNREINSVAFSPDSRELAFGCGKQVLIHELVSGRQQRFVATDDEVFAIEYSPDGARIALGDRQGTVTLCERASGGVLTKAVKAHPPLVYDVAFSPDGRLLATCGADASIKLWRVHPDGLQEPATTLRGHMGYVNSVAFSPDGTRLVSACGDQTLKIWDPHRAAELATLYGHHHYAGPVEFAKDGRTIYSAGFDGEIHFWEAPPLAELDLPTKNMPIQSRPARSYELK